MNSASLHPDPPSLFPFRVNGHYTAEGYKLLAEIILTRLKIDGMVPSRVPVATVRLDAHRALVSSLAFTPDGKLLVSGGWDGAVCFHRAGARHETRNPNSEIRNKSE